jgi:hypothetical protein
VIPAAPLDPGARPPVPESGGAIGTPHVAVFVTSAPDARWVVLCQPRVDTNGDGKIGMSVGYHGDMFGDAIDPYLVTGAGAGEKLDDYVASDKTGRYLAVLRGGKLVLIDTTSGKSTDLSALGADKTDDINPFGGHRAASFDDAGRRMTYIRVRGGRAPTSQASVIVVRDLATGAETEIDPGPGLLFRASIDPGGEWVAAQVVGADTDGNGKLELPLVRTSLSGRRCRGPIAIYGTYGRSGDAPELRVAPASGGVAKPAPDLLLPLGRGLLMRSAAGALSLLRTGQPPVDLAPASCGAKILHGDPTREQVVVACSSGVAAGGNLPLELHSPSIHRPLGASIAAPSRMEDNLRFRPARLVRLSGAGGATLLVDHARQSVVRVPADSEVLHVFEGRALLARGRALIVLDVETGREAKVGSLDGDRGSDAWSRAVSSVEANGGMARVGQLVIDLAGARAVGAISGEALAISTDGRVLLAARQGEDGLTYGPLKWQKPSP